MPYVLTEVKALTTQSYTIQITVTACEITNLSFEIPDLPTEYIIGNTLKLDVTGVR